MAHVNFWIKAVKDVCKECLLDLHSLNYKWTVVNIWLHRMLWLCEPFSKWLLLWKHSNIMPLFLSTDFRNLALNWRATEFVKSTFQLIYNVVGVFFFAILFQVDIRKALLGYHVGREIENRNMEKNSSFISNAGYPPKNNVYW